MAKRWESEQNVLGRIEEYAYKLEALAKEGSFASSLQGALQPRLGAMAAQLSFLDAELQASRGEEPKYVLDPKSNYDELGVFAALDIISTSARSIADNLSRAKVPEYLPKKISPELGHPCGVWRRKPL